MLTVSNFRNTWTPYLISTLLELAASEEDERYRYLLKNGIVRRVEDEDKIIFAELP